jgi:hypothetical protein
MGMTYVRVLETLASNPDIETCWNTMFSGKNKKQAANSIITFIQQNGTHVCNPVYDRNDPIYKNHVGAGCAWSTYYRFPSFGSCILNNVTNARRLYDFFFKPKRVIAIYKYE